MQRTLPDQIKNRDSIRHGLVSLASIFTIGRLLCGVFSIASTFRGMHLSAKPAGLHQGLLAFDHAARAVFWGIRCDGLDGPVARLTGRASDFGRELDSPVGYVLGSGACAAHAGHCARAPSECGRVDGLPGPSPALFLEPPAMKRSAPPCELLGFRLEVAKAV